MRSSPCPRRAAGREGGVALEGVTKWGTRAGVALVGLEVAGAISAAFADACRRHRPVRDRSGAVRDHRPQHRGDDAPRRGGLLAVEKDVKFTKNEGGLAGLEKGASFEPGFMSGMTGSLQSTLDRMKALDEAMAKMVQGGHAQDAQVAFNGLADAAAKQGVRRAAEGDAAADSQALDEAAKKGGDAGSPRPMPRSSTTSSPSSWPLCPRPRTCCGHDGGQGVQRLHEHRSGEPVGCRVAYQGVGLFKEKAASWTSIRRGARRTARRSCRRCRPT